MIALSTIVVAVVHHTSPHVSAMSAIYLPITFLTTLSSARTCLPAAAVVGVESCSRRQWCPWRLYSIMNVRRNIRIKSLRRHWCARCKLRRGILVSTMLISPLPSSAC